MKPPFLSNLFRLGLTACLTMMATACVTDNPKGDQETPEIFANMPLDDALTAAIKHGGKTLKEVKTLVKRRNDWPKVRPLIKDAFANGILSYEDNELVNAANIYFAAGAPDRHVIFTKLTDSGRPLANRLGWRLATLFPDPTMANLADEALTIAIKQGRENQMITIELADALVANKMTSAYTFVREGLMGQGNDEYAKAMIALNPKDAARDFFDYLRLATADELRQLTLTNVNLFTCATILKHLAIEKPDPSIAGFDQLYLFAVSRNRALAELANHTLIQYVPTYTGVLAAKLSRQPVWVQMAYLENARRNLTPKSGLILGELKLVTANPDVIEEINEIAR